MLKKLLGSSCLLLGLTAVVPNAHAGFVFFNLPGLHAGESARVAEQIVCANLACNVLDYQFYVANTGLIGIDGVAMGLGAVPGNFAGTLNLANRPGGADGPFPASPGLVNNGGTLVLGPCLAVPCGPIYGGPAAWGFEEFQDPGSWGGLPALFYAVRWYSPIQGPFSAKLLPGRYVRLDLYTVFGPAGGTGMVDPLSGGYIGFDDVGGDQGNGGNANPEFDPDSNPTWPTPCDPETDNTCTAGDLTSGQGDLNSDATFAGDTQQSLPEPATIALLGLPLVALGVVRRRKRG